MVLTNDKFMRSINLRFLSSTKFYSPSPNDMVATLYQICYQKKLKGIEEFKKNQLPAVWQFVCHLIIRSLSGRTGGTDNMGIKLLEIVYIIYTGNAVNYWRILWDDFLQYIPKEAPKEDAIELTFSRLWSLYIFDLHKEAKLDMGNDTNLFSTLNLKRYTTSIDQTVLGPLRCFPMYILESTGLTNPEVADHIVATSGIPPYHSSPPRPN